MKNKIIKFILFLVVWALIYWLAKGNFGVIAFLFACLFVYSVDKNALIFLANEFDKNHNALADNLRELQQELESIKSENSELQGEIRELRDDVSEIEQRKNKRSDDFYDFIDEVENERKAP